MTVFVLELLAKCDEWLDISSRPNNMNDDVQCGWIGGRPAVEMCRCVCRCWRGLGLLFGCQLDLLDLLRKPSVGLVYMYIDAPIIW